MECLATAGLVVVVLVLVVCSSVVPQLVCCSRREQGKQYWRKTLKVLAQHLHQRVVVQLHKQKL
jgi:hypothetical protein